ncbi:MAG: 2TM domain-containing protein [Meiothermus sp.]|nr:2TM domain-containing protein [Meiothermus sp.]
MTGDLRGIAEKRAQAKLGFYIHASIFVLVSAMQLGINLFTTPWVFWSVFSFMGWGLGVAIHGLVVWFKTSDLGEYLIEEELELQSPQIIETPFASSVRVTEKPQENQH